MNMRVLAQTKPAAKSVVPPAYSNLVLQRRATDRDPVTAVPPIVHDVLNSPGQPLDSATRAFMEPRFGHDFGNVRVHTDAKAADSARAVFSHAYTVGKDVVFGENRYAPTTDSGRELLAHELAHTIQQRGASGAAHGVLPPSTLEASAEQAGCAALSGRVPETLLGQSPLAVARQPIPAEEEEEEDEEEESQVSMALPAGKVPRITPSPKHGSSKSRRRSSPSTLGSGGLPYHFAEGGRILTEEEWKIEEAGRKEKEEAEAKTQRELAESHNRLEILRGMIDPGRSGYIYSKAQIMAMITKDSLLDGQILKHHGVELPPGRSTKQKEFTDDVVAAIDKFDYEWRKSHGTFSTTTSTDVGALAARQKQERVEAAKFETYSATTESVLGGVGASVTSIFTDDPEKIAAGAQIGVALSGALGAAGYAKGQQGMYSPEVEGPGPFANPVGPWRYSGPAPTTSVPTPPASAKPLPTTPAAIAPPKTSTPKVVPASTAKVTPEAKVSPKDKPLRPLPSGDPRGTIRATPGGYQTTKPSQPDVVVRKTTGRTPDPAASFDPYQPSKANVAGEYHFRQFEKGGKIYQQAEGRLGMPNEVQTHRDVTAQRKVSGGTGDDAGHLIGNRFGPPGTAENLGRQNWVANRVGNFHALEDAWATLRRQGVQIDVQVTDVTRIGADRPFMRNVQWTETAPDDSVKSYEVDFANTTTPESRTKSGGPTTSGGGKLIQGNFGKQ